MGNFFVILLDKWLKREEENFIYFQVFHMLLEVKNNPTNDEAIEIIEDAIGKKAFLFLIACCKVDYEGRAVSKLGLGERSILIKGDGSFIIHQDRNLEPINWQPPKTKIKAELDNGLIKIVGNRRKPREKLELQIKNVHLISYYIGSDSKDLELAGYEEDMRQMILKDPELIEQGLRPTSTEYKTSQGFIDILGKDQNGALVIMELKSRKAGVNAVKQLKRYIDCFLDHKNFVRGVLVSPSITDDALKLLESYKMEHIKLAPPKELKSQNKVSLDFFK